MATTHKMLIDGNWEAGKEHISVIDKYTCEVIGEIPRASKTDVERAVDSAKKAFISYSEMPAHARAKNPFPHFKAPRRQQGRNCDTHLSRSR